MRRLCSILRPGLQLVAFVFVATPFYAPSASAQDADRQHDAVWNKIAPFFQQPEAERYRRDFGAVALSVVLAELSGGRPVRLKNLAARFGFSPGKLSARFREETGIGFVAYVTRIRIEKAKQRCGLHGDVVLGRHQRQAVQADALARQNQERRDLTLVIGVQMIEGGLVRYR